MSGVFLSHSGVSATEHNLRTLLNPMKMQNLSKIQQEREKKHIRIEITIYILMFILIVSMIIIFVNAIYKEQEKVKTYQRNQTIVLSDTTNEWVDNFDSTYVFNGCVHYTHKSI